MEDPNASAVPLGAKTAARPRLPANPSNTKLDTDRQMQRSAAHLQASLAAQDGQALLCAKRRAEEQPSPLLDAITPSALEALMLWEACSTSGEARPGHGGGGAAGPQRLATLRLSSEARPLLGRAGRSTRDVNALRRWLEAQTQEFNETFGHASSQDASSVDFLMQAATRAKRLYAKAYNEMTRQVTIQSDERGRLMADIWIGYSGMVDSVLRRLQQQYQRERQGAALASERAALLKLELEELMDGRQGLAGEEEDEVGGLDEDGPPSVKRGGGHRRHGSIARNGSIAVGGDAAGPGGRHWSVMAKRSMLLSDAAQPGRASSVLLPDGFLKSQGQADEGAEAVREENAALKDALEVARMELSDAYKKIAELECACDEIVDLESRAEMAENERDELATQVRCLTPRPGPNAADFLGRLGKQGLAKFMSVVEGHKHWAPQALAELLVGGFLKPDSHLADHVGAGLACLAVAVSQGLADREAIKQAVLAGDGPALAQFAPGQELRDWLTTTFSEPLLSADHVADFLIGSSQEGYAISPDCYACLRPLVPELSAEDAAALILKARASTRERVERLETELPVLRSECQELRDTVNGYREAEQRRDVARRRREEEAQTERKNPIQQYIDLLQSQDEAAWKDTLIGMGQGPEIPKLFRLSGKVRNKHIAKRDTEKLVKEIWKERLNDPAVYAGKAGDLVEFICTFIQKKVGIMAAVVEMGYNFLYGLWKYQWDADCELFLKILQGEVSEDVYVAQVRAQEELEDLFEALDRAKGQATGFLQKDELRTALISYFKLGQQGGKSYQRFDELMQALDEDQEGEAVEWAKVFEEDREFNQGEFAEAIRDQFLQERMEYFKALEEHIYEECAHQDDCTRLHAARALMAIDLEMTEKAAAQVIAPIFGPGVEVMAVKVIMRKISRGIVQRARAASTIRMSVAKIKPVTAKGPGRRGPGNTKPPSEAILAALEAVRKEWIQRELDLSQAKKEKPQELPSVAEEE